MKESYEKEITLEELLSEADTMFKTCVSKFNETSTVNEETVSEELYNILWKQHKSFCSTYPVVMSLMTRGYYHRAAFKQFINYFKYRSHKTEAEYLDSQSAYIRPLMRKLGVKDEGLIKMLQSGIRKDLENSSKKFNTALKAANKQVDKLDSELKMERRDESVDMLRAKLGILKQLAQTVPKKETVADSNTVVLDNFM